MKMVFRGLVFVGILLSLACAHKKYTEQAAELAAAGNHELASRRALDALDLASDHTPAIVILSSSGPRYVDAELEGARSRAESESFDDALARLEALGQFVGHAGRYGVKLDAGRVERQAEETREVIHDELTKQGAIVDQCIAYRTVPETEDPTGAADRIRKEGADWITFTSSSTVENFFQLGLPWPDGCRAASIGPITSKTLREHGHEPAVEAAQHDIPGLLEALAAAATDR